VSGGGDLRLHVEETGNPYGKPILFIHGFSQCGLAWKKQMNSDLAKDFRLVAMDLRGHGLSEKPSDVYGDSRLWADDVNAVITTLGMENTLLAGWSYGGIVISDYIASYGEDQLAGTCWISAVSRLGEPLVREGFLSADFLELVPGFFSENAVESVSSLEKLIRMCMNEEPAAEDLYLMLGYNTMVPPSVRQGLFARNLSNDSVIEKMAKPMRLICGQQDRIVLPGMCTHIARLARSAKVSNYPNGGHALFWEVPERFNRELREFRESI
jgi:pimeloyl-ACP methyl ester carboxylesterase